MTDRTVKAHILIVEDSQGVARALHRALGFHQNGSYRVETCDSGESALEWLYQQRFDLLITDLRLPGIDGLDLLERAGQINPEMRGMLITGYGSPEIEARALQLANAYLPKPFRLQDIIRIVERVLNEPAHFRQPVQERGLSEAAAAKTTPGASRRKKAHLIVLASDLDGTLAEAGELPLPQTWEALKRAKMAGLSLILVTGRTLESLLTEGAGTDVCEAIVAENGAVVYFPKRETVALPFGHVDPLVLHRMEAMGVPLERGMAIVATVVPYDEAVLKALRDTKSGASIDYNRDSVMVLPSGATKGTGLLYALRELGYSPHNVVACGDAENDRTLFEVAEVAVAVANARSALKEMADIVLPQPGAAGVLALIDDLLEGRVPHRQPRFNRRLQLGHRLSGMPLHVDPFALVENNVGIFGASGSGKSWLAGLLAEELLKLGYQICIIDPEGDYRGLATSPNTLLFGGPETPLPAVSDVINFCEWNTISLVLDLSMYTIDERTDYVTELMRTLRGLRTRRGRPHCFLVDEIQSFCPPEGGELTDLFLEAMQWGGFSVISYRPSLIAPSVLSVLDHWMITRMNLPEEIETLATRLMQYTGGAEASDQLPALSKGQALICPSPTEQWTTTTDLVKFRVGSRAIPHIRHLHKYLRAPLPAPKRFYFYNNDGFYLGYAAANLWEFREILGDVPPSSLQHHLKRGDFESWLTNVLHDDELARRIHKLIGRDLEGEALRQALLELVIDRYEELETLA